MIVAIITAGGKGTRLSNDFKKQFALLNGKPLLFWAIDKFVNSSQIDLIVITLPQAELEKYKPKILTTYPSQNFKIITGGPKRQDSVYNALNICPQDAKYVLIHDGVRPFVREDEIEIIIDAIKGKHGVIPVCSVKNTIKEVVDNKVIKTLERSRLKNVLTPQAFDYKLLIKLYKKAAGSDLYFTDDAAILEHYGYDVFTIKTSPGNFKITDKFDLRIAKIILNNRIEK